MSLNPRHLRYLIAISETGSMLAAAKALNVAQPSLSVGVARLEDVVGTKLVERGRHGARLTDAGRILVRHGLGLEKALANALVEVRHATEGISGPLVVGGTPLATASIIPEILSILTSTGTRLSCRIIEGLDEDLIARLTGYEVDLVVCTVSGHGAIALEQDGIVTEELFRASTSAVVRRDHPLARRPHVSLQDLRSALWVLPPPGSTIRKLIDSLFSVTGNPFPENLIEAAPFGVLKEIVKRTDAVTILSDPIVLSDLANGTLQRIPLTDRIAPRVFGLRRLESRTPSPIAERFIATAHSVAQRFAS